MTYFAFLGLFLAIPIVAFLVFLAARRKGSGLPDRLTAMRPAAAIAITALVAVVYTTPWDNYLVATGVWGYHRSLVSGIILGYVPLEEYLFFVLQTVLTSLGLVWVAGRNWHADSPAPGRLRLWVSLPLLIAWGVAGAALAAPWGPSRYTALLFAWALPPILIQVAFGADLLWQERRIVVPTILAGTLYYALADIIAVSAGTWDFNPALIFGVRLGPLPIEEVLFFLLTNVLIVFSVTLLLSTASMERFRNGVARARGAVTGARSGKRRGGSDLG
jgi:lycopene cyclase domain-containing protein